MINFTNMDESVQAKRKLSKKLTSWVEDVLPDEYDDWIVMVNEMQCYEPVCRRPRARSRCTLHAALELERLPAPAVPATSRPTSPGRKKPRRPPARRQGCAPLETVVSLLGSGQQSESRVFKIFKPMKEVEKGEVATAVENALSGSAIQQHLTASAAAAPTPD